MRMEAGALRRRLEAIFRANGCTPHVAATLAETVLAAEIGGTASHGLFRMPSYVETLRSGWVDGSAEPLVEDVAPGLLRVDGRNGFCQVALAAGRPLLVAKTRSQGVAAMAVRNSHHFGAVWPDLEPLAEAGLAVLAFLNTRSFVVPAGGRRKLFGTNPMGFAWPRPGKPPLLWDQSSSVTAHAEVLIAARDGRTLPPGIGFDTEGRPTTDPHAILESGALAPFGGHKGSAIALMVELMAAGLSGGQFGFQDRSQEHAGAHTCSAGMTMIAIDPGRLGGDVVARAELLFEELAHDEGARLPGSRRLGRRRTAQEGGVPLTEAQACMLESLGRPR